MVSTLKAEDVQKGGLEQGAEPYGEGATPGLLEGVGGGVLLGGGGERERERESFLPLVPQPRMLGVSLDPPLSPTCPVLS